jgi:predicted  nucleic acid-binding Zn-ribbon protein
MNPTTTKLLAASKLHASILRVGAERKRQRAALQAQLKNNADAESRQQNLSIASEKQLQEARQGVASIEAEIALQERRKQSVTSSGTKKMQEKVLGEIRIVLKALQEQLVAAEQKLVAATATQGTVSTTVAAIQNDESLEPEEKLNEREAIYKSEYDALLKDVSPAEKNIFEGVLRKFPMDPMVFIQEGNCSGCFTRVLPPLIAKVQLESGICRCDDCGRILYNPPAP